MTWLMNGSALSMFSMFWGAMFMPPAVTIRSFLRSVMVTKPSGSSVPMSPVWNQPPGWRGRPAWRGAARAAPDADRPAEDFLLGGGAGLDPGQDLGVDLLEHA